MASEGAPLWTDKSIFNTYPEKTTLQLSGAAEQAQFLATHVPELSEAQAQIILGKAFGRDSSAVFGGSRIRGDFTSGFGHAMKTPISFDDAVRPVYTHLEPIVDALLASGNSLARPYRWGENRTGYFCFLSQPIDFDLVTKKFDLPEFVRLNMVDGSIECDRTWVTIRGGMNT